MASYRQWSVTHIQLSKTNKIQQPGTKNNGNPVSASDIDSWNKVLFN